MGIVLKIGGLKMSPETQLTIYKVFMVLIGVLLFVAGVVDIRERKICRKQLILLLVLCCAAVLLKGDFNLFDAAVGLAVGLCAVGVSVATREQIGKGDGIVIAAMGIVLGARKCLWLVAAASFMMSAAAILVLLLGRGGRQTKLPFLPAIFAGYLLCMYW